MRYDNPELVRQLAAEYVIGTLHGAARRRFESLLEHSGEARFQRDFWEQRLAEFGQALRPVAPPEQVREHLLRRTAPAPQRVTRTATSGARTPRRALWGFAAGFATAASLVAAFLLGQRHTVEPQPAIETTRAALNVEFTEPPPEASSIYAAQVRLPASSMGWLLSITPDHDRLIAVAAEDLLQVGRHRVHLWGLVPDRAPVSLGDLPIARHASTVFVIPPSVRGHDQVTFAVTLEPLQGAADGVPSGPVMNEARSLADL